MGRHILLVDDENLVRQYLAAVLVDSGFQCVDFSSAAAALDHLTRSPGDIGLIISDIRMPDMGGLELLSRVRAVAPGMPFVMLSGAYDQPMGLDAFRGGATDFLFKPVTGIDLVAVVKKYLRNATAWNEDSARRHIREFLSSDGHSEGASASLLPLLIALETRRFETLQHSQRVSEFSTLLGFRRGLRGNPLQQLERGALLHDIGKILIPQNVIEKPGRLNDEEWRLMRLHPSIGASLLSEVPDFDAERSLVLCHHERFDGSGYPGGLAGDAIPLNARIFAVADALDAICSNRPYRSAAPLESARREICRWSDIHFDPAIVSCFQATSDSDLLDIQQRYPEPYSQPA